LLLLLLLSPRTYIVRVPWTWSKIKLRLWKTSTRYGIN